MNRNISHVILFAYMDRKETVTRCRTWKSGVVSRAVPGTVLSLGNKSRNLRNKMIATAMNAGSNYFYNRRNKAGAP